MGGILACICCYCCLTTLKPRCIEICALIFNILEIGFLIWGILDIPWDDISRGGKIIYFVMCSLIVITFIILLVLMCLRCGNKINTTKNNTGKCLCITMVVLDILAEILIIIAEIIILNNMNDNDVIYTYNSYDINRKRNGKYSNREWAAAVISFTITEIALAFHCYCSNFLLKLIYAKTNLSYLKYIEQKQTNNIVSTVNVYDISQKNFNTNQLNFIGYDKDGRPIYSGNTKYFTQNLNTTNISAIGGSNNGNPFPPGN